MLSRSQIIELFASIDEKNREKFVMFLTRNCSFRFGNLPVVHGVNAISEFVGGFFDSIASLNHELSEIWPVPGGTVCHGTVSYVRHDKSVLSVPFSTVFKVDGDKISEYLIFADTSELYS
ncbi:nuclear transport factor 2 family protein [Solemya velum gill symbiont]|uniref:SnoaL-like domain-containing protein n=1 Tax=Solemya velum gill symbiont TaxID=2340 RepID=A0A0B0H631_SOVGS|nr:nuclear transport factor 2 family protein [Solemya velum gill symbiont]KHF24127.1 hypothetical protein JV46_29160 [Solemya velum gill symbiont]OOY36124.1 hypothetical protein BOV88_00540 [Solemya velum gill symbiont]OOY38170.1 hypothetical protein BOV89_03540 [Solemya velum gill symbiont]OOY39970.1 hypothetical protein BOV90_06490 [Solemya velum gill symbiont]OOY47399.1 hypothetical protein BOV92_01480 [Solemya velum gill symbiont]